MGYIGNEPTTGHFPVDNLTSSGGSTYTLSHSPASAAAIEVSIQGVVQSTSAYSVSGNVLTLAGVSTGLTIFIRHLGETLLVPTPGDGTVTNAKIVGMDSSKLTGTIVDARLPSTALNSNVDLTTLSASNLTSGTVADARLGTVSASKLSGALPAISGAALTNLPGGGKVLQVVTNHVTNVSSTSRAVRAATNITGLNATITPASTGSKILIQINWCGEDSLGTTQDLMFGIKRGTTMIGNGVDVNGNGIAMTVSSGGYSTEAGSSMDFASYQYIDSPSTASATTYHAYVYHSVTAGTLHTNRTAVDGSSNYAYERAASSITLTELSSATVLVNGS